MVSRAALVAKVTGRPFEFRVVSALDYRRGLFDAGLMPFLVDTIFNIQEMWAVGGCDVTTGDVQRLAGRAPRPLEDVLRNAAL